MSTLSKNKSVLSVKGQNEIEFIKDHFMLLSTVRGAEKRKLFYVNDHSLIETRLSNRNGVQERRVRYFMKCMIEGNFDFHVGSIYVSVSEDGTKLVIDEGHHRFIAAMRLKLPIVLSITESNTMDKIAFINSSLPQKWSEMDHFYSALTDNYPLAISIDKSIAEMKRKTGITRSALKPHDYFALLTRNVSCFSAGDNAPKRIDYLNQKLVREMKGQVFKKELNALVEIKNILNKTYRKDIIKAIFSLHFEEHPNFNLYRFVDQIKYNGFTYDNVTSKTVKQIAINICM